MSKYDQIPLKRTKARVKHICLICREIIEVGNYYYTQRDKFLHSLTNKKFCEDCCLKYGALSLNKKAKILNTMDNTHLKEYF